MSVWTLGKYILRTCYSTSVSNSNPTPHKYDLFYGVIKFRMKCKKHGEVGQWPRSYNTNLGAIQERISIRNFSKWDDWDAFRSTQGTYFTAFAIPSTAGRLPSRFHLSLTAGSSKVGRPSTPPRPSSPWISGSVRAGRINGLIAPRWA